MNKNLHHDEWYLAVPKYDLLLPIQFVGMMVRPRAFGSNDTIPVGAFGHLIAPLHYGTMAKAKVPHPCTNAFTGANNLHCFGSDFR